MNNTRQNQNMLAYKLRYKLHIPPTNFKKTLWRNTAQIRRELCLIPDEKPLLNHCKR